MVLFMIPVGIMIATNVLVGNNIGAFKIETAKFYAKMCFLSGLIWALASVIAVALLKWPLIDVFTADEDVKDKIAYAIPILNIFIFFDCLQGVGTGIIRGLGRQGLASLITVTGYWVIGMPISYFSVFSWD